MCIRLYVFIGACSLWGLVGNVAAAEPPLDTTSVQSLLYGSPYGAPISLNQAKAVMAAAESEAAKLNCNSAAFAIVDPSGALVLFEKMDQSTYVSIEYAQRKAYTAAITRRATTTRHGVAPNIPALINLAGGVPIIVAGKTIGAIGVSGIENGGDQPVADIAAAAAAH